MRASTLIIMTALILAGTMSFSLRADYLKNTDFKEGSQCWRGDGQAAFLKADGTEGADGDKDVVPVIKITLSKGQRRAVYQEFQPKDAPARLHVTVQIFASVDFKRSSHVSDYQTDDFIPMPNTDFLIRLLPDYYDKTARLKPGEWVTVDCEWGSPTPADDRSVYFFVPPGDGTVYLKNPSVTP